MTEHNHRRGTRKKPYPAQKEMERAYAPHEDKPWKAKDYSFFHARSKDKQLGIDVGSKSIGNDFVCGKRGMRRSVAGAKKFVNSRRRAATKQAIQEILNEPQHEPLPPLHGEVPGQTPDDQERGA